MLFTLAETIFDVRTSFPFERSWYISPVARPMVVLVFCFAILFYQQGIIIKLVRNDAMALRFAQV